MLTALTNGALVSGIARASTFRVVGSMLEGPMRRLLVDLRHTFFAGCGDNEDLSLLAAHERTDHFLNDPVFDQSLETLGRFHTRLGLLLSA